MNPVNKFKPGGEGTRQVEKRSKQAGEKSPAKPVQISLRSMSNTSTNDNTASAIQEIPGVDFLEARELPSKRIAGPFYGDSIDRLIERARVVRDRAKRGTIFIARDGVTFSIFKRRPARA